MHFLSKSGGNPTRVCYQGLLLLGLLLIGGMLDSQNAQASFTLENTGGVLNLSIAADLSYCQQINDGKVRYAGKK